MNIVKNFSVKRASTAQAGELIRFNLDGHASLGVVLRQETFGDSMTIAVFDTESEPARMPFWTECSSQDSCMSYGTNWCIELNHSSDLLGDRSDGIAYATEDSVVIRLSSDQPGHPLHLKLPEATPTSGQGAGVAIDEWTIWAKAGDMESLTADPLFVFSPAALDPT